MTDRPVSAWVAAADVFRISAQTNRTAATAARDFAAEVIADSGLGDPVARLLADLEMACIEVADQADKLVAALDGKAADQITRLQGKPNG